MKTLDGKCSVSSGKIYWSVLNREREGGYLGETVQIIPHITNEIKHRIYAMDDGTADVVITEIGGTVGDIESQPFLEAIRQVATDKGRENVLYIHVPLIVSIPGSGELKSKPTQHSVKELLSVGIQPDVLVCRTDSPIPDGDSPEARAVLQCRARLRHRKPRPPPSLYEVPAAAGARRAAPRGLPQAGSCLSASRTCTEWQALVGRIHEARRPVKIALVGKYTGLHDAYLSVVESLFHAGTALGAQVEIEWVESETLTPGYRR